MPLPNIVTNGLVGYWHPARVDKRLPGTMLATPITIWSGLTGYNLTASVDLKPYFKGTGGLSDPYRFHLTTDTISLNGNSTPASTFCIWLKVKPEEVPPSSYTLFGLYIGSSRYTSITINNTGHIIAGSYTYDVSIADETIHFITITGWVGYVGNYPSGGYYGNCYFDAVFKSSTTFYIMYANGLTGGALTNIGPLKGAIYSIYTYNRALSDAEVTQNYQAGYLMRGWGNNTVLTGAMATEVLNSLSDKMKYMTFIKSTFEETSRVAVNLINNIDLTNMLLTINCKGSDIGTAFPIDIIGVNFYKDDTSTSPTLSYLFDTITFNSSTDTHNLFIQLEVK